jgi:hypothetical protein
VAKAGLGLDAPVRPRLTLLVTPRPGFIPILAGSSEILETAPLTH